MASILIIDDQPWVQELLIEELTCEGYQVAAMCDAKSVVKNLTDPIPDLVVLDLYLDGIEGFGVLSDIKKRLPDLPIIIFTAYDTYVDDPRLSQADGYVIKSFRLDELKQKIADVLKQKVTPLSYVFN
jgi:DNA-binding NtrC family response regulator